ncbi:VapE domain-containing protein [Paralcaligenes ginsengisoli]
MEQDQLKEAYRWLESLQWDGVDRLSTWLTVCLGVANTAYTQQVGGLWIHQAVNRLIRPGSKADYVLVLDGPQGLGKSSALRALAGPWFSDAPLDLSSKDAFMSISGSWIHEITEIDSLSQSDAMLMKAFLTQDRDQYRLPYASRITSHPRQTVFAATSNNFAGAKYLTSGRRFLPVRCTAIDLPLIHAIREQLFSQALYEITPSNLTIPQRIAK